MRSGKWAIINVEKNPGCETADWQDITEWLENNEDNYISGDVAMVVNDEQLLDKNTDHILLILQAFKVIGGTVLH